MRISAVLDGARSCLVLVFAILLPMAAGAAGLPLDKLRLPPGFRIELLTDAVPNARAMTLGPYADGRGVLYVGSMGAGKVYAVELANGRATAVYTVARPFASSTAYTLPAPMLPTYSTPRPSA